MPIISQTLNINNLRTTGAKSITLDSTRKLIEYSLNNVIAKAVFTSTVFEILFEVRSALSPAQLGTGTERNKVSVKNQNNIRSYLKSDPLTSLREVFNGF